MAILTVSRVHAAASRDSSDSFAAAAAAGGGGEALIAPTDGVEKLVGQRVEAVWEDKDGSTDWFPATIVAHWPTTSEHDRLLMHFDDGMDEIHAARRHRAPDRRGCCCAVQVCPVCCPARGRGWRLYAAASAASAAATDGGAARGALYRAKPGMANGVPHPGRALFRPSLS